jgi:sugar phosphate isomerase/epimerase
MPPATRPYRFIAFTKPWKIGLPELGRKIAALGFDGIELPVRPGYPVHPDNVTDELPRAARLLKDEFGLTIESVAGPTNTATIAACCEAGVNLIRICPAVGKNETYGQAEARLQSEWRALVPFLDEHGVAIGVQNHSDRFVPPARFGSVRLLDGFEPKHVCAVWDAAHEALNGWEPDLALDVLGVGPACACSI